MLKLSEVDITRQIKGFMESHGWRAIRMQRTVVPGQFQTAEPGCPDYLFLFYLRNPQFVGASISLWIELKRPKARMRCKCLENRGTRKRCTMCDQNNWRTKERARGGVVWSGVDDLDWFMEQYGRQFSFLHSGDHARGQLDLLTEARDR